LWLCWPRFDSDACFAALLGSTDNGRWRIAPTADDFSATRKYHDDTLILETRFETADGVVTVTDFMPVRNNTSDLVRIVTGVSGRVTMCMEMILRFGYGAIVPWVSRLPDRTLRAMELYADALGDDAQKALVVAGGVAANQRLRAALAEVAAEQGFTLILPPVDLCTDNAAMVAWAGAERLARGLVDDLAAPSRARWPLDPDAAPALGAGVKA